MNWLPLIARWGNSSISSKTINSTSRALAIAIAIAIASAGGAVALKGAALPKKSSKYFANDVHNNLLTLEGAV